MKKRKLNITKNDLIQKIENKMTKSEIAKELKISISHLNYFVKKYELQNKFVVVAKGKKDDSKLSDVEIEKIKKMGYYGVPIIEIANYFKVSSSLIVRKKGPTEQKINTLQKIVPKTKKEIVLDFQNNINIIDLCFKYNIHYNDIKNLLVSKDLINKRPAKTTFDINKIKKDSNFLNEEEILKKYKISKKQTLKKILESSDNDYNYYLDKNFKNEIIFDYNNGMTQKEILKKYNINYYIFKKIVPYTLRNGKGIKISENKINKMISLYQNGVNQFDIIKKYNVSFNFFRNKLIERGVIIPNK